MTTKERVIYLRQKYPNWTLGRIAIKACVTSEGVRQILKKAGLPTAATEPKERLPRNWRLRYFRGG